MDTVSVIDSKTLSKARIFQDWVETLSSENEEIVWRWVNKACKKLDIYTSEAMALFADIFVLVHADDQSSEQPA